MSTTAHGGDGEGVATAASREAREARPESMRAWGGMPRWLLRAIVVTLVLLGCFRLVAWAVEELLGLLVDILVAFFAALAMEPAVARLAARGVRRGAATWLVFLVVLAVIGCFVGALGSLLVDQVTRIIDNLPAYVESVVAWVNDTFATDLSVGQLQEGVLHSDWLRRYARQKAEDVWGLSATVLGGVFQLLTVLLFAFYFTADGPRLRRTLCSVLPPAKQAEVLRAWDIAVVKTGGYLYSRGLMALVSALSHYVFLRLLGVPYAPALALWVGAASQFVPTVGTYLAGALPVLLAFTVDPWSALWVLGFVVVYQQFENYLLQPRLSAMALDIHPAVAFGSVVAGTALLGVVGALIAVPATATLQGFLGAYVRRYEVTDPRVRGPWGARGRRRRRS